jgi:hypothetical protein
MTGEHTREQGVNGRERQVPCGIVTSCGGFAWSSVSRAWLVVAGARAMD